MIQPPHACKPNTVYYTTCVCTYTTSAIQTCVVTNVIQSQKRQVLIECTEVQLILNHYNVNDTFDMYANRLESFGIFMSIGQYSYSNVGLVWVWVGILYIDKL